MVALGILMLVVGALAILVEAHLPSGGVVAVLGALCAAAGTGLALSASGVGLWVTVPLAVVLGLLAVSVVIIGVAKVRVALHSKVQSGPDALIGARAEVRAWSGAAGQVQLGGGLWTADLDPDWELTHQPAAAPQPGETVVVQTRHGLTLTVRRQQPWELQSS